MNKLFVSLFFISKICATFSSFWSSTIFKHFWKDFSLIIISFTACSSSRWRKADKENVSLPSLRVSHDLEAKQKINNLKQRSIFRRQGKWLQLVQTLARLGLDWRLHWGKIAQSSRFRLPAAANVVIVVVDVDMIPAWNVEKRTYRDNPPWGLFPQFAE